MRRFNVKAKIEYIEEGVTITKTPIFRVVEALDIKKAALVFTEIITLELKTTVIVSIASVEELMSEPHVDTTTTLVHDPKNPLFKQGQRAFDIRFGWGTVGIVPEELYSVIVKFDNIANPEVYTNQGFAFTNNLVALLQATEYTLAYKDTPTKFPKSQVVYCDKFGWGKFYIL